MTMSVVMITVDTTDPAKLAGWWADALGGEVTAVMPGEFVFIGLTSGLRIGFQRVDDPTPGKNRVHVDFDTADLDSEVARLVALGATETDRHAFGDDFRWVVLADPEGNAFCVAAGH